MGTTKKSQRIAEAIIGLSYDSARKKLCHARRSFRFIISRGLACGRNASISNSEICVFLDENDRVARAVVGSKGIYNDPEFLALEAAGKTTLANCLPFDAADYLDSEEAIAAYLDEFKDDTPDMLASAQVDVARARARMAA